MVFYYTNLSSFFSVFIMVFYVHALKHYWFCSLFSIFVHNMVDHITIGKKKTREFPNFIVFVLFVQEIPRQLMVNWRTKSFFRHIIVRRKIRRKFVRLTGYIKYAKKMCARFWPKRERPREVRWHFIVTTLDCLGDVGNNILRIYTHIECIL